MKIIKAYFAKRTVDAVFDGNITNDSPKWKREPLNKKYISVNFETVGKCPRCKADVTNAINYKDAICPKCDLALCWDAK